MASQKCVYPYPTLIISDAATVEWVKRDVQHDQHRQRWLMMYPGRKPHHCPYRAASGSLQPVVHDVRFSFYQPEGKPWDWARARRLADQCYAQHGMLAIEHNGQLILEGDELAWHREQPAKRLTAKVLQQQIRQYLAGNLSREQLEQLAA